MEADFSGWATKAGLVCTDGRTIMPDAFKHQDQIKVPLVWQHGHTDPENVLGHAVLENREGGVYAYGFFNKTPKAEHARQLLEHGDINMLSIWANQLVERSKRVLHGAIREVSLVLSGANPGALIESVTIRHSDGDDETLEDEAIIYTGLTLEHADAGGSSGGAADKTIQDVFDSMTDEQKQVVYYMIGQALDTASSGSMGQSALSLDDESTISDVYNSMTEEQQELLHYMVGEALTADDTNASTNNGTDGNTKGNDTEMGDTVKHNVFEGDPKDGKQPQHVLSHSDMKDLLADATRTGSLKEAVEEYAIKHGIQDIDVLFPDAKTITNVPELFGRRTEWVQTVLAGVRKSPFSRIKTVSADITVQEARAKGYIKGSMKKEEFFRVAKRVTTPTTIYKKQKLDRDDMIDITDFDVVAWLKGEMRIMLDEEVARAILIGDGRPVDDEDKINEDCIRPIASDNEVYVTTVNVNIDDTNSSIAEVSDAIISNRSQLRGTGLPTMFTTESYISRWMLLKDTTGRRIYKTMDEVAAELRVSAVVPVEVLEEQPDVVCILVNLADYVVGADRGGEVSMFDDFDIDYNQYKYLIEGRMSGALVKLKSALVVRRVAGADQLATPATPAFDGTSVTVTNQTGVVYRNAADDSVMNAAGSPYAVAPGTSVTVVAEPASGYYFPSSENDTWSFTNNA